MEQLLRDARITPIYEGTNGIQALDLLGRKVFGTGGRSQQAMAARIRESIARCGAMPGLAGFAADLARRVDRWDALTTLLAGSATQNPDEIGAAAVDYLQYSGYVCLGWCWLVAAGVATRRIAEAGADTDFYRAKLATARHYFERLLPRAEAHEAAARAGAAGLMALPAEHFAFA